MLTYNKISKRNMLKNDYANNIFSYYKKTIVIVLSIVICFTLCFTLLLNLNKFKPIQSKIQIVIVGDEQIRNFYKGIESNDEFKDVEFVYYSNAIYRGSEKVEELEKYNVPIKEHGEYYIIYYNSCMLMDSAGNLSDSNYNQNIGDSDFKKWINYLPTWINWAKEGQVWYNGL